MFRRIRTLLSLRKEKLIISTFLESINKTKIKFITYHTFLNIIINLEPFNVIRRN